MLISEFIEQLKISLKNNGDKEIFTGTKGPDGRSIVPELGLQGRRYEVPQISKLYYDPRNPETYCIVIL